MKLTLLMVGKTTDKHIQTLCDDYAARLRHYLPFDVTIIPELKQTKALTEEQQKEREGQLILQQVKDGDWLVLLDEGGQEFRSMDFAQWMQKRQASGARRLIFVIGGPYGFSPAVYAAAREKVSLSRMTFSHQMVRLFAIEQFYRAQTILHNEPYHHE